MKAAFFSCAPIFLAAALVACGGGQDSCSGNTPEQAIGILVGEALDDCVGGSIGDDQKHYQFAVGVAASTHTIGLTETTGDLSWVLAEDSAYTITVQACDDAIDASDESCQSPELAAGRTYFLRVRNFELQDGPYRLLVSTP